MTLSLAQSLLDGLPMPALLIGPSDRIMQSNAAARALLGDGITGRHFITAIRQPVVLDAIELTQREAIKRKTRVLTSDGGQDISYDVTTAQVDVNAKPAVLVCFEDVTHMTCAGQMRRDFGICCLLVG